MSEIVVGVDALAPAQIAERVRDVGVRKAHLPLRALALLGVMAGGFIGLGSLLFTLVASDPTLGFAAQRVLGGLVFCLGLLLVVVAGAELFTGNNLVAIAWAARQVTTGELLLNWLLVCMANLVGAVIVALLAWLAGHGAMNGGAVGRTAIAIATAKAQLPWVEAFARGVLCNLLVCMAVWMTFAGHSVTDKVVAIVFPITGFVAAGFEHSVANMYFFPVALLLGAPLPVGELVGKLAVVIAGNLVGGCVLVAGVYWTVYLRPEPRTPRAPRPMGKP